MNGHVIPLAGARAAARAAARSRHPAARSWAPDRTRVLERLADRAGRRGAPWPRVAAAVLLLRGVAGDDRVEFARRVGVSPAELADLELGVDPAVGRASAPAERARPGRLGVGRRRRRAGIDA